MSDAKPEEGGLASGLVNTSFMMGGSLGLAVLASLAASRTGALAGGAADADALNAGYQVAFAVGAVFALVAAAVGLALREREQPMAPPHAATAAAGK
jgi:hypothetical protein